MLFLLLKMYRHGYLTGDFLVSIANRGFSLRVSSSTSLTHGKISFLGYFDIPMTKYELERKPVTIHEEVWRIHGSQSLISSFDVSNDVSKDENVKRYIGIEWLNLGQISIDIECLLLSISSSYGNSYVIINGINDETFTIDFEQGSNIDTIKANYPPLITAHSISGVFELTEDLFSLGG